MSASDSNARSAVPVPSTLPQVSASLKHKPSSLLEPQTKVPRTNLAEQAAQPYRKPAAPPTQSTIRPVNENTRKVSRAGPKSVATSLSSALPRGPGLPISGFGRSVNGSGIYRPSVPRTQSALGTYRGQPALNERPALLAGHKRTQSHSAQAQLSGQQATSNNNGKAPPFPFSPTSATAPTPFSITTFNSNQYVSRQQHVPPTSKSSRRTASAQSQVSATRSTSNSTTGTLIGSERSVSNPISNSLAPNRQVSLCRQLSSLDLNNTSQRDDISAEKNAKAINLRMLPPALPVGKAFKSKSSIPVLSPDKRAPAIKHCKHRRHSSLPDSLNDVVLYTPAKQRNAGSPTKSPAKTPQPQFLSKGSNTQMPAATDHAFAERLEFMDEFMRKFQSQMEGTTFEQKSLKDMIEMQRVQLADIQLRLTNTTKENEMMREQLEDEREQSTGVVMLQQEQEREHEIAIDDMERKHRYALEDICDKHKKEVDQMSRDTSSGEDSLRRQHREEIDILVRTHRQEVEDLDRRYKKDLEVENDRRLREVNEISTQRDEAISKIATGIGEKEREADVIRRDLEQREQDLEREKQLRASLELRLTEITTNQIALESSNASMRANLDFLKSDNDKQSQQFADLHRQTQHAIEEAAIANAKLRAEESLRRKLHNQVQELKGNIRVFCRVRPNLEETKETAKIDFPDEKEECHEIAIRGAETTSARGVVSASNHAYNFDRVFGPASQNSEVFEEISQLIQSALDGYNVCIFCYGQTGSGKTHTMSSVDGMIPRAVRQIYDSATALEEKGWKYKMQGSFVEVYNENINDLLGRAEDLDKKKHEIHHDTKKCKTTISGIETVDLDTPDRVQEVLDRADGNRSVAATKANERSSRSHSVFMLTLTGENSITGEKCEGTLNLVDLAGSERLSHSQAEGQRLKETQNINKSLASLGDVIWSLGNKDGHVPYRNSKLTYLLQYSLGGNSKTLMFVMVSPLQAHLSETITSLKFATKVQNTHIGTAKRQSKTA